MSSSPPEALPSPPEWPARRAGVRQVLSWLFIAACTTVSLLVTIVVAAEGGSGAMKYLVLVTLLFGLVLAHGFLVWLVPGRSVRDIVLVEHEGRPATMLRYSGPEFWILSALMACLTAIFALATVDYLRAGDDVTAPLVAAAASGAVTLFLGSYLVAVATGRVRRGHVLLAADGIHQRGRAFESFLPWESLVGARAIHTGRAPEVLAVARPDAAWRRRRTERVWRLDRLPPAPMIEVDCLVMAVDQRIVHHFMTFYVDNPSARAELGTPACLRRAGVPTGERRDS